MAISRRKFLAMAVAAIASPSLIAHPGPHHHPHRPGPRLRPLRPHRPLRRRRLHPRRRVIWRRVHHRRHLVVPLALAIGWELFFDGRPHTVVVVNPDSVVVRDLSNNEKEIPVVFEDTADNISDIHDWDY
ncbi:hypothetical protein [Solemya velum gill symbiont]|uniref:hypothetical protein n=1 Tax=Solemya velum gill symbiont TaxID=2340 RepID=UPI0015C2EBD9|nr:hypothetical protein [Solemya velum gill symbiont]